MADAAASTVMAGVIAAAAVAIYAGWVYIPILYNYLQPMLAQNHFLQAIVIPSVFASCLYALRVGVVFVYNKVFNPFFSSVSFKNSDENWNTILEFLADHVKVETSSYIVSTAKRSNTIRAWKKRWLGIKEAPKMEFMPANNSDTHFFKYKGSKIVMTRTKGQTISVGYDRHPLELETLVLTVFGRDRSDAGRVAREKVLKDLVDEALSVKQERDRDCVSVFVLSSNWPGGWELAMTTKPRSLESVILDENLSTELIADAKNFLESGEWYADRGIPYRRGYLLYGPPGCGKTSFCTALSGALHLDICMLTLASSALDDTHLCEHLREAPANSIILLEDVDAIFKDRTAGSDGGKSGVTFSGLLNALDGVASQQGRILFMTTNHIERLDPALIRPGRCDVRVELKRASKIQMKDMFLRFFPGRDALCEDFCAQLPVDELSMAQLQGHLLAYKHSAEACVAATQKLLSESKPVLLTKTSLWEYLKRARLEALTPFFEHNGYTSSSDLANFKPEEVREFCPMLRWEPELFNRLKDLLEGKNAEANKEFSLAEVSTIREMYLEHYSSARPPVPPSPQLLGSGAGSPAEPSPSPFSSSRPPLRLKRAASSGLPEVYSTIPGADAVIRTALDVEKGGSGVYDDHALISALVTLLTKDGKGLISVGQLSEHFSLYPHRPGSAVAYAYRLTAPRDPSTLKPQVLTAYQWLRRAGLEKYVHKFVDEGMEDEWGILAQKDFSGVVPSAVRPIIEGLLGKGDAKDTLKPSIRVGFRLADFHRIVREGSVFYSLPPSHSDLRTLAFSLCDPLGRGRVSLTQLWKHFEANRDSLSTAVTTAVEALITPQDVPVEVKPPKPIPTDWTYQWLQRGPLGSEELAKEFGASFIREELKTRESLLWQPRLTDSDLKDTLGVNALGKRRLLLAMLEQLWAEADAETAVAARASIA